MKVNFKYIIHGQFILPTKEPLDAKKQVDSILVEGDLDIIKQGMKYTEFEIGFIEA